MEKPEFTVTDILSASRHLDSIKILGRSNAKTLGFFPDGAFEEYADKGLILVALSDAKECVGYLLYRVANTKVVIVHLCVDESVRGQGVARDLVRHLCAITNGEFRGISLRCRRDFDANKIWPRLGFRAIETRKGRSKHGSELTSWWLDHQHPDLFSVLDASDSSVLDIAIDANVFYDLEDPSRLNAEESQALLADWIYPHLKLSLTPEMMNEADRLHDRERRKRTKSLIRRYPGVKAGAESFLIIQEKIRALFPDNISEQDESDHRHLSWVIASDVLFFVTRDEKLIDLHDTLYKEFGVSILRPAQLVMRLDDLYGESKSQPSRLAGTLLEFRRLSDFDEDSIVKRFYKTSTGEKKSDFRRKIRIYVANKIYYSIHVVSREGQPVAIIVFDRSNPHTLNIPLIRVSESRHVSTIAFNLILRAVKEAVSDKRSYLLISDKVLDDKVVLRLLEDGFNHTPKGYVRPTLDVSLKRKDLQGYLDNMPSSKSMFGFDILAGIKNYLKSSSSISRNTFAELEKKLWPLKILDAGIPTFLVPIRPKWAHDLFDETLANETLFGARPDLALNREGVYYRSRRPDGGLRAPGRILWYVSDSKYYGGAKHLRACSHINEVTIGKPGTLYRRYRRLGVYRWDDVFATAKEDQDKDIMAILFSETFLFRYPIPWKQMQATLQDYGIRTQLQSPIEIPPQVFSALYKAGNEKV